MQSYSNIIQETLKYFSLSASRKHAAVQLFLHVINNTHCSNHPLLFSQCGNWKHVFGLEINIAFESSYVKET